ncbi:hypothetical protein [Pseudomonas sp. EA_35y_Pfl2_R5]|uniref:hypothetical protein n=1 Tax=Pseudomonas sp. EA_35y_Pfl2_R5 TaxID=3088690 RepID=UPI0030D98187
MDFHAFSPIYKIFSRSELLVKQEMSDLANQMIDGRTIHFYFQYVYPELNHETSKYTLDFEGKPCYSLNMACSELEKHELSASVVSVVENFSFDYPLPLLLIADSDEAITMLRVHLAEALEIIDSVQMLWLVSLATGAVTTTHIEIANCCYVGAISSAQELAKRIMMASAAELRLLWMRAEAKVQEQSQAIWTSSDFSELILNIFNARLNGDLKSESKWSLADFDRYVYDLDVRYNAFPLTKHLLCIWTLGWQRSVFLEGSPFDFAATLEELYKFSGVGAAGGRS